MGIIYDIDDNQQCVLCEPVAEYSRASRQMYRMFSLFSNVATYNTNDIRVVELFAGVGGFRIGLERASSRYRTIWSNQWEPSTKKQDASIIYCKNFGADGHSNQDINTVPTCEIPEHDLLVGGFPCQDYSVATTLKNSGGIEGKKGVLWWQIYRILNEMDKKPNYIFLENVDRILKSPSNQRGRDFAIILASLSKLGYYVEWRVINAADYGMPQRRRRTYIVGYQKDTSIANEADKCNASDWILNKSVIGDVFKSHISDKRYISNFTIKDDLATISSTFNIEHKDKSPFYSAGLIKDGIVMSFDVEPEYTGKRITLGEILLEEDEVSEDFFISTNDLNQWEYLKGSKSEKRITKDGYEYNYTEGGMSFPDVLDKPSRTIITGEGGAAPSRFKHIIKTPSGRYRRLTPIELERLNMFPDNHTKGVSDVRRAFLMGNALVTGIVEKIGNSLIHRI